MPTLQYYRVYCLAESNYVEAWMDKPPVYCPNNNRHGIDPSLTEVIRSEAVDADVDEVVLGESQWSTFVQNNQSSRSIDSKLSVDTLGKLRVSQAQSYIGTDFNYGYGPGEWESMELVNNVPGVHYRYGDSPLTCYSLVVEAGSSEALALTATPHSLNDGDSIVVTAAGSEICNGGFFIKYVSPTCFSFVAKGMAGSKVQGVVPNATAVFAGRFYTGSSVNLESVSSDNEPNSILTVTTADPNGFKQGTFLNLVNAAGSRRVYFDAEDILYGSSETLSNVVDTSLTDAGDLNPGAYLPVVPWEWEGSVSAYFAASNVDVAAGTVSLPHGQSVADRGCVMYAIPAWEQPVGGLEAFSLYQTRLSGQGRASLYPLEMSATPGLVEKTYVDMLGVYASTLSAPYTAETVTSVCESKVNSDRAMEYTGIFVPQSTGEITFETYAMYSEMAVWFDVPGVLGEENVTLFTRSTSRKALSRDSFAASCVAGRRYGFKARVACYKKGTFRLYVNGSTDGAGRFFNTEGVHYVDDDSSSSSSSDDDAPPPPPPAGNTIGVGPRVSFTSCGTSALGLHSFLRAYPVVGLDPIRDLVSVESLVPYGLSEGQEVVVFSKDGAGIAGAKLTSGALRSRTFNPYRVRGVVPTDAGCAFSLVEGASQSSVNIIGDAVDGLTWVVPIRTLPQRNTVRLDDHAFEDNSTVTYEVLSGDGIEGLVDGWAYRLNKVGKNFVTLSDGDIVQELSGPGGGVVQFSQTVERRDRDVFLSPKHGLANGDAVVYSQNSNAAISGLVDGDPYTVANSTTDAFMLKTATGSNADVSEGGSGSYYVTTSDGTVDGRYRISRVIDDYTFEIKTQSEFLNRVLVFDPRRSLVLGEDSLYLPDHGIPDGAEAVYATGGTPIGGLSNEAPYSVHRVDGNYVKLRPRGMDTVATLADRGLGSEHRLEVNSVMQQVATSGNCVVSVGSRAVTCVEQNLDRQFRRGDAITVECGGRPETYTVEAVSPGDDTAVLSGPGVLQTGDFLFYGPGGTDGSFSEGHIYFVNVAGSNSSFHHEKSDALTGTGAVVISDPQTASYAIFTRVAAARTVSSVVKTLTSLHQIEMEDESPCGTERGRLMRSTQILPSQEGVVSHRAVDGGILIRGFLQPNMVLARQTKTYFPYQSGKGMHCSASINFNPPMDVSHLSREGLLATVVTYHPHNLAKTTAINVSNVDADPAWNGNFVVLEVPSATSFTYLMKKEPENIFAPGIVLLTVRSWSQCSVKCGIFDQQNGFYVEYDGKQFIACRRNSILQVPGTAAVSFRSNRVVGTLSRYADVLVDGDHIVIKGQTYRVSKVYNNELLFIQPAYRGVSNAAVFISKTIDTKVTQPNFSLDRLDGTGPSGYKADPTRIQMVIIEYSWYGAGKAQVALKGNRGEIVYCHEFIHNNIQYENFSRSGSLPVRFEISTGDHPTYVPTLQHWGAAAMLEGGLDAIPKVPLSYPSAPVCYTGMETRAVTADTEGAFLGPVPGSYAPGYRVRVDAANFERVKFLAAQTPVAGDGIPSGTVTLGNAAKTADGGFVYLSREPTAASGAASLTVGSETAWLPHVVNLLSLRIVPSADSDRTGGIGVREVVNRISMVLTEFKIATTHDVDVDILLSATLDTSKFERVGGTSLVEVIQHAATDNVADGMVIYSFRAPGGAVDGDGRHNVRETRVPFSNSLPLTNSVLGGDGVYPDGPEIVTARCRPVDLSCACLDTPLNLYASFGWKEL